MDPAGCPEAPSAIRWASSTLQLGEWPRKVMKIRPSQLPPTGTRRADAGQPGFLFGGHGPSGGYDGSYAHQHWENPYSHTGPQGGAGVWGASMPWSKKPYFWEKAVHTRNSATAKPGKHQQDLAGALVWAACWRRGLTQRGPEELSVWENLGGPENLGSYTQKIVRE